MNTRALWWIALAFTLMWIWMEWMKFTAPKPPAQPAAQVQQDVPAASQAGAVPTGSGNGGAVQADAPSVQAGAESAGRVHVKTDVLDMEFDLKGGDLRVVKLLKYAQSSEEKDKPFLLMSDSGPLFHILQNGLTTPDKDAPAPTHKMTWRALKKYYTLKGDTLQVPFVWEGNGLKVTKVYTLKKGHYDLTVTYTVENHTAKPWQGSLYSQLKRNRYEPNKSRLIWTYTGPAFYDPENKYHKISFDDLLKQPITAKQAQGGWVAMIQHYFLAAVVPDQQAINTYYAKPLANDIYVAGVVGPLKQAPANGSVQFSHTYYVGPIIEENLAPLAEGLELTKDFGMLTWLAEPIFWVLKAIHSFVGNWGWSIILLVVLIKLAFYKLSETSYRSMARLRKFQPKLQQLKENYGDDKQLFQQKLMQLYKEEKINPMGGCLPILVQMPVFIALYWVLLYSVELRQAPWLGWIQDLSAPDPYYILPVIMGISMWLQMKLNPTAMMDETQQKVMQLMPFIFTIFFLWFPSGLVLYWVVNNILTIAQQWYITRKIEQED